MLFNFSCHLRGNFKQSNICSCCNAVSLNVVVFILDIDVGSAATVVVFTATTSDVIIDSFNRKIYHKCCGGVCPGGMSDSRLGEFLFNLSSKS